MGRPLDVVIPSTDSCVARAENSCKKIVCGVAVVCMSACVESVGRALDR